MVRRLAVLVSVCLFVGGLGGAAPAGAVPPTCSIAAPTAGSTVTGTTVGLSAVASAGTPSVQFAVDGKIIGRGYPGAFGYVFYPAGSSANGWASTSLANGTNHKIKCRAYSTSGLGAWSAETTFGISNPNRTWMAIPSATTTVSGTTVMLNAGASVTSGSLPTYASFYVDGASLGHGSCGAYGCILYWDSTQVSDGPHVVHARSTGSNGVAGKSDPITVIVSNEPSPSRPQLVSSYETAGRGRVGRDGGYSRALPSSPGTALWTFGDSGYVAGEGPDKGNSHPIWGNTNAEATYTPGQAPDPLQELPNPDSDPDPEPANPVLIPPSPALRTQDGQVCGASGTDSSGGSWTTGVVGSPVTNPSHLLIAYVSFCNQQIGSDPDHRESFFQVFGLADYDPATKTATPHDVFVDVTPQLDARQFLGSPMVDGGYLYLYRAEYDTVYAARVELPSTAGPTPWTSSSNYTWWTGTTWGAMSSAASITPSGIGSDTTNIHVDRYPNLTGNPLLMIVQEGNWSRAEVWTASTPSGPWTKKQTLNPCPSCVTAGSVIYSVYGHPELTATSSNLLWYTYYDPATDRIYVANATYSP